MQPRAHVYRGRMGDDSGPVGYFATIQPLFRFLRARTIAFLIARLLESLSPTLSGRGS